MGPSGWKAVLLFVLLLLVAGPTQAQVETYYLHRENSTVVSTNMQLKTAAPDASSLVLQTVELRNQPAGEYVIKTFETQANVPNIAGVIPSNSSFLFRLYMGKTADAGNMNPRVKIYKNNASGTPFCTGTGFAMPTGRALHTFTCFTSSAVTFTASDRFFVWVGVSVSTGPGATRVKGELAIEQFWDSRLTVILPTAEPNIANLSPTTGSTGTSVTINGSNFGSTQALSTVSFNGILATPTSWSNTSIVVPVPPGASTGPVVVTVNGIPSNGVTFTTTAGSVTGTITRAGDGVPISGALVEAVQNGLVKGSATTLGDGTYSIAALVPGTYDIRASAAQYATQISTGVVVVAGSATTANLSLPQPGTITGRVTQDDGVTPIVGAIVKVFQGANPVAKVNTNASGDYTASALAPGTYTVQASASGFNTSISPNATVTANNSTTVNFSLTTATNNNPVRYVYDELGRLVAVIDPAGDTARYVYDSVGNILSISRQSSSLVSVLEFTPKMGLEGTVVTIYGTGFDPTPSGNTVTFNGTAATVSSSSATQIVTTLPAGATTGLISVTTAAGSDTSDVPFVVGTNGPIITSFTPNIGTAGSAVSITGQNFEAQSHSNRARFNGTLAAITASTTTSISTTVPSGATSGRISVATPLGEGFSANDFFVPPSSFTAADVEMTGRMAIGETKLVTIGTANKIALIVFDGVAGQRISLQMTGVTISSSSVAIFNPNGSTFASTGSVGTSGGFIDTKTLGVTGTYTILVDPASTNTGSLTLNLFDIVDATGTITAGGSAPVTIVTPGQNAEISFSGSVGQHVSLTVSGVTVPGSTAYTVKKPDGSTFASAFIGTSGGFLEIPYLTSAGTYTIHVDPSGAGTGNLSLTLNDATDATNTITPGGPAVVIGTTIAGQNARLTFTGAAGQRIAINATNNFSACWGLTIIKPDGTNLSHNSFCGSSGFVEPQNLPVAGTYTILIDPSGAATGQATVTVFDITDINGTIAIDGPTVTHTLGTSGQVLRLTFSGTSGVRLSVNTTSNFNACWALTILKPDATQLSSNSTCSDNLFIEPQQLPVTGTYTLVVDPTGGGTGTVNINLYSVTDTMGTISIGGSAVLTPINPPGQVARLTFSGTTSQRLSVNSLSNFNACWTLTILKPDATQLSSTFTCSDNLFIEPQQLPANGTYTIVIDPSGPGTGQTSTTLYNVVDTTQSITIGGTAVVSPVGTPGQIARLTFTGSTTQRLSVKSNSNFNACWTLTILKPDATQLSSTFSCADNIFVEPQQLPVNGTYTIVIDPSGPGTGQTTTNLYNVTDVTGSVTLGGPALLVTTSTPGQNANITFSGTTGQLATVRLASSSFSCVTVTLIKPDGTNLTSLFSCSGTINLTTQTLPATGTYTIKIDPSGTNMGSANVSVTNP
ncbi:MAG TPA: carboxypeptidase regulatory-like domain-containing protein [Pyrinomonadaceae bacterium]|nr:carboxypeptidase regulatory-like domain-containing protein [Pyrinomonadaceae bacterium]